MPNSFFNNLVEKLISVELEGGYVNNPVDNGGETKYGISKKAYPNLDIRNLTKEKAIGIYSDDFWKKYNLHRIESYEIAWLLFKSVVVTNAARVIAMAQSQCLLLGYTSLAVDGVLGEKTLSVLNLLTKREVSLFIALMESSLAKYYTGITLKDASQKVFLRGWLNRLFFK